MRNQPRSLTTPASATAGAWYFYNPSAISFGLSEFLKRWGTRKLEDNWRRSEKDLVIGEVVETVNKPLMIPLLSSILNRGRKLTSDKFPIHPSRSKHPIQKLLKLIIIVELFTRNS